MDSVVGQDRTDLLRNGGNQGHREGRGHDTVRALYHVHEGELRCPIDGCGEIEVAFGRLHFRNNDMEVADWIALELLLWLPVAFDVR